MKRVTRRGVGLFLSSLMLLTLCLASCNVTRTITTTSSSYSRGDTAVIIQTKTVEMYDGTIKPK